MESYYSTGHNEHWDILYISVWPVGECLQLTQCHATHIQRTSHSPRAATSVTLYKK